MNTVLGQNHIRLQYMFC